MALEYHEPREILPEETIDQHRAISSLIEELEAITWYHQRAAATTDAELKAVIEHNRDEEMEHASMLLEWLRRNFPGFEDTLRTYLFKDEPIVEIEEKASQAEARVSSAPSVGSLAIGSMKGQRP